MCTRSRDLRGLLPSASVPSHSRNPLQFHFLLKSGLLLLWFTQTPLLNDLAREVVKDLPGNAESQCEERDRQEGVVGYHLCPIYTALRS